MTDIPRRSLAVGAGLLAGAMALDGHAQVPGIVTVPKFAPKPMTFNPDKVPGLSANLLRSHHANNYAGTVAKLNATTEELAKLDFAKAPVLAVSGLKREEHIAYNSTILHELYFDGIAEAPTQPSGLLAQAIARDFGHLDRCKAEFAATGKALAGGSGWVILAHSPRDKRLFIHWAADHSMAPASGVPLLAMDMYEHAYHMDYGADAAKYIDAFMKAIKWTNAERLYREAMRL
ncbi:MAG: Fe-Mn family superoxide dismutase [Reyranella sp.]|nr:Fe-Mn family superoxide dismutase [Reyranella sp.]